MYFVDPLVTVFKHTIYSLEIVVGIQYNGVFVQKKRGLFLPCKKQSEIIWVQFKAMSVPSSRRRGIDLDYFLGIEEHLLPVL